MTDQRDQCMSKAEVVAAVVDLPNVDHFSAVIVIDADGVPTVIGKAGHPHSLQVQQALALLQAAHLAQVTEQDAPGWVTRTILELAGRHEARAGELA